MTGPGTRSSQRGTGTRTQWDRDMDCRQFRDRHTTFVDQVCTAVEENEMREHLRRCPNCSRHDTVVRRSLMLFRSLPVIEPSPDFQARLEARLRTTTIPTAVPRRLRVSYSAFAALAAGVAFVTYLASDLLTRGTPNALQMPPVVAMSPALELSPVATSALVATVPTGMSVWPAIVVASQAPMHFVATEMATER
jgi:anti-sigma factor RsiW